MRWKDWREGTWEIGPPGKEGQVLNTVKSPHVIGLSRKIDLLSVVWRFRYLLFLDHDVEVLKEDLGISRVHLPFGFGLLSFLEYFYLFYQRA